MFRSIHTIYQKYRRVLTPLHLYLLLSLTGSILFVLFIPFLGSRGFDWLVMENNSDFEAVDYFLTLLFSVCGNRAYHLIVDVCYSPLSYLFCSFINHAVSLPETLAGTDLFALSYPELVDMRFQLLQSPYHILVFLFYSLFGLLLYLLAIDSLHLEKWPRRLLALSVILSVPMSAGALERGNLTLYVAALPLLAFALRDSSSGFKREMALILIALAAGFKFYPAILGVVYLKERRFKETARLVVYGIAAVFLPFLFFGGLDGFLQLLKNLSQLSSESYRYRIQFLQGILSTFGIDGNLRQILNLMFILLLVTLIFATRNKVRMLTYLAAAMALVPPNSYRYSVLFFLLPMLEWIRKEGNVRTRSSFADAVFYGLIFTIPTIFGMLTDFYPGTGKYTLTSVEIRLYLPVWGYLALQIFRDLRDFSKMLHRA